MPKISIIVPVYKTEKYLARCIESILSQRTDDFELILVDDGSPDSCPEICDKYALRDKRILVIHKKNAGVAVARNTGMEYATGDYVTFVDSDDWIEPQMYSDMLEMAQKYKCDVVMCDCVKDFSDRCDLYTHSIRSGYYSPECFKTEYFPNLIMMENVEYPPTISNWVCLFRRNIASKIRYVEGVRFSEDLLFGAEMMYYAKSFYYMKGKSYYHYCFNSASTSHVFCRDKWSNYITLFHATEDFFLPTSDAEIYNFREQIDKMLLFFVYNTLGDIRGQRKELQNSEKWKYALQVLKCDETRGMFARLQLNSLQLGFKQKAKTALMKICALI